MKYVSTQEGEAHAFDARIETSMPSYSAAEL